MKRKTAARLNRAIDIVVVAMDTYVPAGILVGAWVMALVMATQALPWIFPEVFG